VRIEVERLEHHADALACMVDVGARVEEIDAVHLQAARRGLFEPVEAAKQRGLARARRPDDEDELALGHHQIDALQHMQGAVMLVEAVRLDY
jgi:hypothetical protein